jgi:hypothetical protein
MNLTGRAVIILALPVKCYNLLTQYKDLSLPTALLSFPKSNSNINICPGLAHLLAFAVKGQDELRFVGVQKNSYEDKQAFLLKIKGKKMRERR